MAARDRRWIGYTLLVLATVAIAGIGISTFLLSRWSRLDLATAQEAERAFASARAQAGEGSAYVEIAPDGEVVVHRELEHADAAKLSTLYMLAWDPTHTRLLRVTFPFWFVRLKMSDTLNLGTLTTALAGDWAHLDLRVSEQDLARRGPGIVLDHRLDDGKRILLWTQ